MPTAIAQHLENLRETLLRRNLSRRSSLIHKSDKAKLMLRVVDEDPNFVYDRLINEDKSFNIIPIPEPNQKRLNQDVEEEEKFRLGNEGFIEIDEETSICTWIKNTDTDDESDDQDNEITIKRWAKALGIDTSYEVPRLDVDELGDRHTDKDLQTFMYEKDLIKKLRSLSRRTASDNAEFGIKSLYLALGFLEWYDLSSRKTQSPLILLPISIDIDRYGNCSIQYNGDDIESNRALLLRMEEEGIELPEFDASDPDSANIEEYFDLVDEATDEKDDWCIRRYISMSIYNLTQLEFYEDLDPKKWDGDVLENNEFLKLATSLEEREPPEIGFHEEFDIEASEREKRLNLVLDADPSQYRAIKKAVDNENLVVSGPPGTGKSQTITNMIAQFMSQGNTVLFVSEKKVALDVVRRNLNSQGLGQLCFELLSTKSSRGKIVDDLRNRYELYNQATVNAEEVRQAINENVVERTQYVASLNYHATTMSQIFADSNKTTFDILTEAGALRRRLEQANLDTNLLDNLSSGFEFSREQYRVQKGQIRDYNILLKKAQGFGTVQQHPWFGFQLNSLMPFRFAGLLQVLKDYQDSIDDLISLTEELQEITGADQIDALDGLQKYQEFAQQLETIDIEALGKPIAEIYQQVDYTNLSKVINIYQKRFKEAHEKVSEILPNWQTIGNNLIEQWSKSLESISPLSENIKKCERDDLKQQINEYQETIDNFFLSYEAIAKLAKELEIENISSLQSFRSLNKTLQFFENHKEYIPEIRDNKFRNDELDDFLSAWGDTVSSLKQEEEKLRPFLNINMLNLKDMSPHYEVFKKFGWWKRGFWNEEFKAATDYLSKVYRGEEKASRERLRRFYIYHDLLEQRERFDQDKNAKKLLGKHFQGHKTDVEELIKVRKFYKEIRKNFTGANRVLGTQILELSSDKFLDIADSVDAELREKTINLYDKTKRFYTLSQLPVKKQEEFFSKKSLKKLKTGMSSFAKILDNFIPEVTLNSLDSVKQKMPQLLESKNQIESILDSSLLDLKQDDLTVQLDNLSAAKQLFDTANELELDAINAVLESESSSDDIQKMFKVLLDVGTLLSTFHEKKEVFYEAGTINEKQWHPKESPTQSFSLTQENAKCIGAIDSFEHLTDWIDYQQASQQIKKKPSTQLRRLVEIGSINSEYIVTVLDYIYNQNLAMRLIEDEPELRNFNGAIYENKRSRFQALDRDYIDITADGILAAVNGRDIPQGHRAHYVREYTNLAYLEHEFGKTRRFFPPRLMVNQALEAIQAIKPCFMMRPTEVAKYLPKRVLFDVLIMDEASQIRPQTAFGSLLRAKQYILAGDSKQLPPSPFFLRADQADAEEHEFEDDSESILESAEKIVPRGNQEYLQWHYRSQHHSLINFSNHYFYEDKLKVFRSPHEQSEQLGVTGRYVENAFFEQRRNTIEAEAVVEEVVEHMRLHPNETLMVVTMNITQKEEIERLYDNAFDDPENVHMKDFQELRGAEPRQELFDIKNLENVQGDERDVVFISYTYGPHPETGRVAQRFQTLSAENGWRRLNVLFTRSKKRVRVFHSMRTSDIIPEDSRGARNRGKVAFRDYIEYAQTGDIQGIMRVRGEPENEFEESIGSALSLLDYEVDYQVGFEGFWIDMAVKDPNDAGRYILGIEADGASYHSHPSARARDRLRQDILEGKGWELLRVWSTDWFKDPDSEIRKITTRIEALLAGQEEERQAEEQIRVEDDLIEDEGDQKEFMDIDVLRSREQTRDIFIDLRENVIKPKYPHNLTNGILRKSSLNSFLYFLPQDHEQYLTQIPEGIRSQTDPDQAAEFLDIILAILIECDPDSPLIYN